MGYAFSALEPEYNRLLSQMKITREGAVYQTAARLLRYVDEGRYAHVSEVTGVPQIVMATSFEREASSNFNLCVANGDPWNRVTRDVPRGEGPWGSWASSAVWAYHHDGLDRIGAPNWSWARACFELELFNGFGYRAHGIHSPYLWAGSNIYTHGKYVRDGVFSYEAEDTQLGVIPMMFRMVELRPSLTLPTAFPSTTSAPMQPEKPQAAPTGVHDAAALQAALNKLDANPQLDLDGNYGRFTKRAVMAFQRAHGLDVDGIAGPATWDVINQQLAPKPVQVAVVQPIAPPTSSVQVHSVPGFWGTLWNTITHKAG